MSWLAEVTADSSVNADGTPKFYKNGLRFATKEEAEAYASDLYGRWTSVRDKRVVESADPVTHKWQDQFGLFPIEDQEASELDDMIGAMGEEP
jgi:hypothetical protein